MSRINEKVLRHFLSAAAVAFALGTDAVASVMTAPEAVSERPGEVRPEVRGEPGQPVAAKDGAGRMTSPGAGRGDQVSAGDTGGVQQATRK